MANEIDNHCMICDIVHVAALARYMHRDDYRRAFPDGCESSGVCRNTICLAEYALSLTEERSEDDFNRTLDGFLNIRDKGGIDF